MSLCDSHHEILITNGDGMYAAERQREIAAAARKAGRVEVTALADLFDVRVETIRRDLAALEERGQVHRVHGGALPVSAKGFEPTLAMRAATRTAEKDAIAAAALGLIDTGVRSLLLDAGTTTSALARSIAREQSHGKVGDDNAPRELTVVTNSVTVASILADAPGIHLHILGGRLRTRTMAAVGRSVTDQLEGLNVDLAFLGGNGLHSERGLTTPDAEEAQAKRAMSAAAASVVALTDATKLGQTHLWTVCPIGRIDTVVTDAGADPESLDLLSAAGPEVVLA